MERALSDPVPWMAVLFFGCAYLTVAVIYAVVVEFPTSFLVRARTFAGGMLSPGGFACRIRRRSLSSESCTTPGET
jgi:hypothetical protein